VKTTTLEILQEMLVGQYVRIGAHPWRKIINVDTHHGYDGEIDIKLSFEGWDQTLSIDHCDIFEIDENID
jgi:hypothetical protein